MLYLGLVSLGIGVCLIVVLVGDAGRKVVRVENLAPTRPPEPVELDYTLSRDDLPSLFRRFAGLAGRLTPANYGRSLQHKLDLAGNPRDWKAERVLAFKGFGLAVGLALGALMGAKHGVLLLFLPLLIGAFGFFAPDIWVRNLGERRQIEILYGLPDALDMMTVCVEAGLGFDAALSRVATTLDGAMASECSRVLQEMQFGMSRSEALRAMVQRTDVAELRTFVSALVQSTNLGISVGDVLREQSNEMRIRRRQRAEEKAQKLPVKILMPLILCMLPSMFVVALGPAVITIAKTFGGFGFSK
jgi:tight adherence protein C